VFVLYGADNETPENMIHALGSILSSPVVEDGMIYFGSSDGHLYAVSLQ
jgi:outer membrane protein assembly factor BamB